MRPLAERLRAWMRRHDEDGQTLVEYALVLSFIALIVFLALVFLGPVVSGFYQDMGDTIVDIT